MGPSKRKGVVRRQVLDLNSKEDSPQRSAWQTKYQTVLPDEEMCFNGDSESLSKVSNNPLSGLLGNYNSDSDSEEPAQKVAESLDEKVEDFLKEIQSISAKPTTQDQTESSIVNQTKSQDSVLHLPSVTGWQQCYDHSSGYPYYWNTETNEVTWEIPAEMKAAIAAVQQQQQPQVQQIQIESNVKKKVCNFPWQTESHSENEKDELLTSHKGEKELPDLEKGKVHSSAPKAPKQNVKIKGKDIKLAPEDLEAVNEFTYETSSLLAHGVQDTGPPGDESFQNVKQTKMPVVKKEELKCEISGVKNCLPQSEAAIPVKADILKCAEEQTDDKANSEKIPDDVIAEIKKENLPNYLDEVSEAQMEYSTKTTGIALIANYGDDSEPEDNSSSEKHETSSKSSKEVFPVEIANEKIKPLFPCMGAEIPKIEIKTKEILQEESEPVSNIYNPEFKDPAVQKAFKRKKRIEFAPVAYNPLTCKCSDKNLDQPVVAPTTQYNMDPDGNEHHGFGFNAHKAPVESERKTYKNCGGIQFIKAETINLKEPNEKETELGDENVVKSTAEESVKQEEIEYAANLLREKVTFLTTGTGSISAIQQMAIELKTLVVAWKDGALTPPYLLRWLNEKCSEITRHEKSAAPAGWTCFWDRKSKRYSYRNVTTKEIQWEYPTGEEKVKGKEEVDGAGDEMDICDTPPHLSPDSSEKQTDETSSTPPPPVMSTVSEMVSPPIFTPQPPSPPQISFCEEEALKKKKKIKSEEISKSSEDEGVSPPTPTASLNEQSENQVPPLPPMPPPPPPPPEESPPPLPDSPPPPALPVESDQPLPPGVDEPECSFFRTPKHSYKKSQPETAAFSAELMMTYGYGLSVQQVVPSNGQPIAMPMQPLEYHTYMQDAVSNSYVVQSSLTSHVIHCPAKKPKPSLTSELVSFYTDLAKMDNSGESSGPNTQTKPTATSVTQEPSPSPPVPTFIPVTVAPKTTSMKSSGVSSLASFKAIENTSSNGVNVKKKKKTKTASGLSLKKKGVSSLVAKWQQVQQEVRRDFSDDDDDGTPK